MLMVVTTPAHPSMVILFYERAIGAGSLAARPRRGRVFLTRHVYMSFPTLPAPKS